MRQPSSLIKQKSDPTFKQSGLNLKYIKYIATQNQSTIFPNLNFNISKQPLNFIKPEQQTMDRKTSVNGNMSPTLTHEFSAYLGRFKCDEIEFLVFVSRVFPIKIGVYEIYKVLQVHVYPLHSGFPDMELSAIMTELLADKSYFSYSFDLTQNASSAYTRGDFNINPFFASMANLIDQDLTLTDVSWYCPIVIGHVDSIKANGIEFPKMGMMNAEMELMQRNMEKMFKADQFLGLDNDELMR